MIENDSREKLEADVRKVLRSAYMYAWMHGYGNMRGGSFEKLYSEFYILLDRQAAITEREIFDEMPHVRDRFAELQAKVDKLAQELEAAKSMKQFSEARTDASHCAFDMLKVEYDRLKKECDALQAENMSLKANSDECVPKAIKKRDEVIKILKTERERLQRENNNLAHDLGDCMAERDQLREIIGKMVDAAHELTRLAALYE